LKIYRNEKLVKRNARVGQIASLGGLGILVVGMLINIYRQDLMAIALGCLLLGFLMSQIGIYYQNRFGRRPLPDERLNTALKGFDDRWSIYHYNSPVNHLLVGPGGIWILMPISQQGKVTYTKGRWSVGGGGLLRWYMRVFFQEGLGRPDIESADEQKVLRDFLEKNITDLQSPDLESIMVFTHENVEINVPEDAPIHTVKSKDLKDFVRKQGKRFSLTAAKVDAIDQALQEKYPVPSV
jgi:hypothetical protein